MFKQFRIAFGIQFPPFANTLCRSWMLSWTDQAVCWWWSLSSYFDRKRDELESVAPRQSQRWGWRDNLQIFAVLWWGRGSLRWSLRLLGFRSSFGRMLERVWNIYSWQNILSLYQNFLLQWTIIPESTDADCIVHITDVRTWKVCQYNVRDNLKPDTDLRHCWSWKYRFDQFVR